MGKRLEEFRCACNPRVSVDYSTAAKYGQSAVIVRNADVVDAQLANV